MPFSACEEFELPNGRGIVVKTTVSVAPDEADVESRVEAETSHLCRLTWRSELQPVVKHLERRKLDTATEL